MLKRKTEKVNLNQDTKDLVVVRLVEISFMFAFAWSCIARKILSVEIDMFKNIHNRMNHYESTMTMY